MALDIIHEDLSFPFVDVSYHLPKFSPCAVWNVYGTIFGNGSVIHSNPFNIFIDKNNHVYISLPHQNETIILYANSNSTPRILSGGIQNPQSVFVTVNDDIFVDDGNKSDRIVKWTANRTDPVSVFNVSSSCRGLFVDKNNTLYCSLDSKHQVIKISLETNASSTAAGNGTSGSEPNMLHHPKGIFVDLDLRLFVADCDNDRIQRFEHNQSSGKTVAGRNAAWTIDLDCPSGIVLDADGYLFITDNDNHRIVRSSPAGFHCLIGCSGKQTKATNHLNYPKAISFDSFGNIFVADGNNNRILKFVVTNKSCGKYKMF